MKRHALLQRIVFGVLQRLLLNAIEKDAVPTIKLDW